jgi:6-phosphogluconolactonase
MGVAHGIGIGRSELDAKTGALKVLGYTPCGDNPATLCVSPDRKYLYAANETKNLDGVRGAGGGVTAFAIDPATGDLKFINSRSSCGTFPAYVVTDRTGGYVLVANHASYFYSTEFVRGGDGDYAPRVWRDVGSVALFRARADGGLEDACDLRVLEGSGHDPLNQASAHPHAVDITDDDFVIVPNKGADTVDVFRLDRAQDRLVPLSRFAAEPGSAPRHVALHPRKPYVFIMNEFNNTLVSYYLDKDKGTLREIQRVFTVPPQFVGKSYTSGDVKVHPNGRFLYGTNNIHPSLVGFRIDEETGRLELIGNFRENVAYFREVGIDPSGQYLVAGAMKFDRFATYRIDQDSGHLYATDYSTEVIFPSCVHFAQLG